MALLRRKTNRRILLDAGDLHGGHKLGLMNPAVVLPNGEEGPYTPKPTHMQEYLWGLWLQHLDNVERLADGAPIVVLLTGDLTHGVAHPEHLVSTRKADHVLIGLANLEPLCKLKGLTTIRVILGTGAHNLGEGTTEILITEMLKGQYPALNIGSMYHGLFDLDGVIFDAAHHGPYPGSRSWLTGNGPRYYLRSLMMAERMDGRDPPRVVLRAHYHRWIHETVRLEAGGGEIVSDIIITPSYCGLGDYGHKATRSIHKQTHGLVAFEVESGRLAGIHPFKATIDLRTKEAL